MKRPVSRQDRYDEQRREFLVRALSAGFLAGASGWNRPALAALFGRVPDKLPAGQSVFEVRGQVSADGKPVTSGTILTGSEKIQSGPGSHLIAVVGADAFVVREKSTLQLDVGRAARSLFRLVTGAMLVVMARRGESEELALATPTATIGVRGTGVYLEAEVERSYICTCYGQTQIAAAAEPDFKQTITALHHDAPRYVLAEPDGGQRIIPAPFINHTDLELMTLEALVGRTVPFGLPADQYEGPRREDY